MRTLKILSAPLGRPFYTVAVRCAWRIAHLYVLWETLKAFCERLGNLRQTAEKLSIHRSSLLYRMKLISQIAGLDMNNLDMRLSVHLALKVRKRLFPATVRRLKE